MFNGGVLIVLDGQTPAGQAGGTGFVLVRSGLMNLTQVGILAAGSPLLVENARDSLAAGVGGFTAPGGTVQYAHEDAWRDSSATTACPR